jgi:16S rRNA (cytidine1402-2'-O)-methyltransferase
MTTLSKNFGTLFIVATPIGNLEDTSLRALTVLRSVDRIAAEDTRHSQKLLTNFQIKKSLIALHDFNETARADLLLKYLQAGENIALISDAGTPLINDPGYHLVKLVRAAGIKVSPVPGACAAIAALCAAGLPTDRFMFIGFLSAKISARQKQLTELQETNATLIFYEAPHRLATTIDAMLKIFGSERQAVIAKELTKQYETIFNGTLNELKNWLAADVNHQKGEFVILVHGCRDALPCVSVVDDQTLKIFNALKKELPVKQAAKLTAEITGANKNLLYKMAHVKA